MQSSGATTALPRCWLCCSRSQSLFSTYWLTSANNSLIRASGSAHRPRDGDHVSPQERGMNRAMAPFLARRALYAVALLFCASLVLFLARPFIDYLTFLRDLLVGNLGSSASTGEPVVTTIARGAPFTLVLGLAAFVLTYATAVPLGILAAWKQNTAWDRAGLLLAVLGMGIPNFFLAILLIQV